MSIGTEAVYDETHSVSEYHLHHYLDEFDYRYNTRKVDDDCTRTIMTIEMTGGKRLIYQ